MRNMHLDAHNNSGTRELCIPAVAQMRSQKVIGAKERLDVPDLPADTQSNVQATGARWSLRMHRPIIKRTTHAIRQHVAFQEGHYQT